MPKNPNVTVTDTGLCSKYSRVSEEVNTEVGQLDYDVQISRHERPVMPNQSVEITVRFPTKLLK